MYLPALITVPKNVLSNLFYVTFQGHTRHMVPKYRFNSYEMHPMGKLKLVM